MTNPNKMAYLKQYKYLDQHINKLIEESERWKSRAEKSTPTLTGMPQGGDGENQRELAMCRMIDCDRDITNMIDELCCLRNKIKAYIADTGDNDERLLLVLKVEQ